MNKKQEEHALAEGRRDPSGINIYMNNVTVNILNDVMKQITNNILNILESQEFTMKISYTYMYTWSTNRGE